MRSARPKPIHLLCGRSMASYVLDTLAEIGVRQAVVVTGADSARVSKRLLADSPAFPVRFADHKPDAHGAQVALAGVNEFDDFNDDEDVIIVPDDVPLLRAPMLEALVSHHRESGAACTVLSSMVELADGHHREFVGQIMRNRHSKIIGIESGRSSRTADSGVPGAMSAAAEVEQGAVMVEVATSVYCVRRGLLAPALRRSVSETILGAASLHDIVAVLAETGNRCESVVVDPGQDLTPVDNRLQLAEAEAELRRRINHHWLSMGVTMVDPEHTYIDATVKLGTDVTIFPGAILQGATVIGNRCEIGPHVQLDRCVVGDNTKIDTTTAKSAVIGSNCAVGPFAVLEPETRLEDNSVTGPFFSSQVH